MSFINPPTQKSLSDYFRKSQKIFYENVHIYVPYVVIGDNEISWGYLENNCINALYEDINPKPIPEQFMQHLHKIKPLQQYQLSGYYGEYLDVIQTYETSVMGLCKKFGYWDYLVAIAFKHSNTITVGFKGKTYQVQSIFRALEKHLNNLTTLEVLLPVPSQDSSQKINWKYVQRDGSQLPIPSPCPDYLSGLVTRVRPLGRHSEHDIKILQYQNEVITLCIATGYFETMIRMNQAANSFAPLTAEEDAIICNLK